MKSVLLGYGYWGKILHKYIINDKRFNLIGVYDLNYNNSISIDKILEDESIEAAFVCTPINTHYSIVKLLLEYGKHVFCEKPLCKDIFETEELFQIAKRERRTLFTDYIYTFSPTIRYMKEHLYDLGKVNYIEASIKQFGKFYLDDNVYEVLGVHFISAIVYLFNTDLRVKSVVNKYYHRSGLCLEGTVLFNVGGIEGEINCSLVNKKRERKLRLICERGIMIFDMLSDNTFELEEFMEKEDDIKQKNIIKSTFDETNNIRFVLDGYYDSIKEKVSNRDLAINVSKVLNQIISMNIK